MTEETPETPETPEAPAGAVPANSVSIALRFGPIGEIVPAVYADLVFAAGGSGEVTAEAFAKQVAETVERTVLFHTGALPVLQRVEVAA